MNLNPCPYRHVGDEGHILCDKIKSGDREVSPNICRVCPIAQISCSHLRATLDHQGHPPVTVRWGNGKTTVWEDHAPSIAFSQAACAEKVIPIHSAKDCANCPLRQPLIAVAVIAQSAPVARRSANPGTRATRATAHLSASTTQPGAVAPMAQATPLPQPPTADARSNIVAQKIIQLQEWLAKQKNAPSKVDEESVAPIQYQARSAAHVVGEEKRVGWTD